MWILKFNFLISKKFTRNTTQSFIFNNAKFFIKISPKRSFERAKILQILLFLAHKIFNLCQPTSSREEIFLHFLRLHSYLHKILNISCELLLRICVYTQAKKLSHAWLFSEQNNFSNGKFIIEILLENKNIVLVVASSKKSLLVLSFV